MRCEILHLIQDVIRVRHLLLDDLPLRRIHFSAALLQARKARHMGGNGRCVPHAAGDVQRSAAGQAVHLRRWQRSETHPENRASTPEAHVKPTPTPRASQGA